MSEARKKYLQKHHKQWVIDNRERARELDTKHRHSPKGLATRKIWDEKHKVERAKYLKDRLEKIKKNKLL